MSSPFEKCGSSISTSCVGATVPMTIDGWQQAADEITNTTAFLIQGTVMAMGSEATFN